MRGSATRVSVDPPEDQGDISVAVPTRVSVDPPEDYGYRSIHGSK